MGFYGFLWRMTTFVVARPPSVAGEPMAGLILSDCDRSSVNGALFKLDKRICKPDRAMKDEISGKRLWEEIVGRTSP